MNSTISLAITISGYISLVVGAVLVLMSKVKTDNLNDLKERVEILEKELKYAHSQHVDNQKAISNLEGQLQTYKEIPLKSIASSLEALPKIVDSNSRILETLQGSAVIAATDRDALVNSNQTVENQVVQNQTVRSKK
jgi:esterase/lipase